MSDEGAFVVVVAAVWVAFVVVIAGLSAMYAVAGCL